MPCPGEGGRRPGGGGGAGRGGAGGICAEAGRAHRGRQHRGPHPGHVLPVPGVPGEQPDQERHAASEQAILLTGARPGKAGCQRICMPKHKAVSSTQLINHPMSHDKGVACTAIGRMWHVGMRARLCCLVLGSSCAARDMSGRSRVATEALLGGSNLVCLSRRQPRAIWRVGTAVPGGRARVHPRRRPDDGQLRVALGCSLRRCRRRAPGGGPSCLSFPYASMLRACGLVCLISLR